MGGVGPEQAGTARRLGRYLAGIWFQEARLASRRLELIREIDAQDVAGQDGYTSTASWLNAVLRVTAAAARRMQATAQVLDHPACVATAAALGMVNEAQAAVIAHSPRRCAPACSTPATPCPPKPCAGVACDAGITLAVLNGAGLPLDLGREQRLFKGALRQALVLRDGGCAFPRM